MKKIVVPVFLMVTLLFTSLPAMAWNHYGGPGPGFRGGPPPPRYYGGGYRGGHRGYGVGGLVGGLIVGGLIAGTVVAATRPPVVVQQPAYVETQPVIVQQPVVVQQPVARMCSEERRVTGEYQYDARGNAMWVEFAYPVVRSYQVPCP